MPSHTGDILCAVYHIGPEGWQKMSGDDVMLLHNKYYPSYDAPPPVLLTQAHAEDEAAAA